MRSKQKKYKPEYSIEPRLAESRPDPSSKPRRFDIKPGGSEPGPDGDGICLPEAMPGDGARRGGVARPNPESVSRPRCVSFKQHFTTTTNMRNDSERSCVDSQRYRQAGRQAGG